jgi:hypothetical protein
MAAPAKALKISPEEQALNEAQQMLSLWLTIKACLQKAMAEEGVRVNDESLFLDAKAELTRTLRVVGSKLPQSVVLPMDKISEIQRQATSIANLRSMPKTDRIALIAQWHAVFVLMCRAVGAFQFLKEGYVQPEKLDAKNMMKRGGGKDAKTPMKRH